MKKRCWVSLYYLLCFRLSITGKNGSIYHELMNLYTFMNSSCCYSSSNSPSLRFFDLHTVRHFAVKISCLGNIIFPFAVPGLPNVTPARAAQAQHKTIQIAKNSDQESSYSSHYILITWTFSIFSYISNSRGRTKKNLKAWAVCTAAGVYKIWLDSSGFWRCYVGAIQDPPGV